MCEDCSSSEPWRLQQNVQIWWDREEKDSVEAKVDNWISKKNNFRAYLLNRDILCERGTSDEKAEYIGRR